MDLPLAGDDAHHGEQCRDEQDQAQDGGHHQVDRVERRLLVIGLAPHAEGARQHGLEGGDHDLPSRPATVKKVYDSAMLLTPCGSFGSMTNITGSRRLSPASSVWCVKQKHSIF